MIIGRIYLYANSLIDSKTRDRLTCHSRIGFHIAYCKAEGEWDIVSQLIKNLCMLSLVTCNLYTSDSFKTKT
jgi:hypothetical protein